MFEVLEETLMNFLASKEFHVLPSSYTVTLLRFWSLVRSQEISNHTTKTITTNFIK